MGEGAPIPPPREPARPVENPLIQVRERLLKVGRYPDEAISEVARQRNTLDEAQRRTELQLARQALSDAGSVLQDYQDPSGPKEVNNFMMLARSPEATIEGLYSAGENVRLRKGYIDAVNIVLGYHIMRDVEEHFEEDKARATDQIKRALNGDKSAVIDELARERIENPYRAELSHGMFLHIQSKSNPNINHSVALLVKQSNFDLLEKIADGNESTIRGDFPQLSEDEIPELRQAALISYLYSHGSKNYRINSISSRVTEITQAEEIARQIHASGTTPSTPESPPPEPSTTDHESTEPISNLILEGGEISLNDVHGEDQVLLSVESGVCGVFDGMSHPGGKIASQVGHDVFLQGIPYLSLSSEEQIHNQLLLSWNEAQRKLDNQPQNNATTVTVLKVYEKDGIAKVTGVHAGDSRAYIMLKDGTLIQISQDDSLVKALARDDSQAQAINAIVDNSIDRNDYLERIKNDPNLNSVQNPEIYWTRRNEVLKQLQWGKIHDPSIFTTVLPPDTDFVFATTDGVHDNLTRNRIIQLYREHADDCRQKGIPTRVKTFMEILGNEAREYSHSQDHLTQEEKLAKRVRAKPDDISASGLKINVQQPTMEAASPPAESLEPATAPPAAAPTEASAPVIPESSDDRAAKIAAARERAAAARGTSASTPDNPVFTDERSKAIASARARAQAAYADQSTQPSAAAPVSQASDTDPYSLGVRRANRRAPTQREGLMITRNNTLSIDRLPTENFPNAMSLSQQIEPVLHNSPNTREGFTLIPDFFSTYLRGVFGTDKMKIPSLDIKPDHRTPGMLNINGTINAVGGNSTFSATITVENGRIVVMHPEIKLALRHRPFKGQVELRIRELNKTITDDLNKQLPEGWRVNRFSIIDAAFNFFVEKNAA